MLDNPLDRIPSAFEQYMKKCNRFLKRFIATVLCLSATVSVSFAEDFACGEWSNSSLQHQGAVSIVLDNDGLTWSNETNSYHAGLIESDTPQLAYSDTASIYMIYGAYRMNDKLYNSGYLRIRRVFFVEEVLKVSELECYATIGTGLGFKGSGLTEWAVSGFFVWKGSQGVSLDASTGLKRHGGRK